MKHRIDAKIIIGELSQRSHSQLIYSSEALEKSYNSFYNRIVKRAIGLTIALIAAVILLPIYLILSLAIIIETGFPVLYRAQRGGYKGKTFNILKFRSMVKNADKIGGGTTALNDKRITKVGAIIRKTKLDELPQLFNVIIGTMSFVGPRPELLVYTEQYEGLEKNILNVRPGMTDFSSLTFINLDEIVGDQNADEMYEKYVLSKKNHLRIKYVAEVSFKTDIILFVSTIFWVFRKGYRVLFRKQSKSHFFDSVND